MTEVFVIHSDDHTGNRLVGVAAHLETAVSAALADAREQDGPHGHSTPQITLDFNGGVQYACDVSLFHGPDGLDQHDYLYTFNREELQ